MQQSEIAGIKNFIFQDIKKLILLILIREDRIIMSKKTKKQISDPNAVRSQKYFPDEENDSDMYCMIAPTQEDVLDHSDESTVCTGRS